MGKVFDPRKVQDLGVATNGAAQRFAHGSRTASARPCAQQAWNTCTCTGAATRNRSTCRSTLFATICTRHHTVCQRSAQRNRRRWAHRRTSSRICTRSPRSDRYRRRQERFCRSSCIGCSQTNQSMATAASARRQRGFCTRAQDTLVGRCCSNSWRGQQAMRRWLAARSQRGHRSRRARRFDFRFRARPA